MANICIVLGKTGTGKSTSIKGLDPKDTIVINVLNKLLPFRGSKSMYSEGSKNLFRVTDYVKTIALLSSINKQEYVKNVVIDDAIFEMSKEFFSRAKETGYGKFTEIAQHFQQMISTCEDMRSDINVFFMLHAEEVESDNTIIGYKVKTIGKLLDQQYSPIEVVSMVLFSDIRFDEKGNADYGFYTHATMNGGIRIPAKTPEGMFKEDWIPNDLGIVVKAIREYV